ncbi:hypothetical protein B0H11DRAFT_1905295 [Mycena galericulata]|nr:hypothetical protein B0H11DRAFT_1905295 [Mycena galericulata]
MDKSGPGMCQQFAEIIDRIETKDGCIIIHFITDADGGSKKGRVLLGKERRYLILPSCWAHQFQLILGDYFKVHKFAAAMAETATALIGWINNHEKLRKIFDSAQEHAAAASESGSEAPVDSDSDDDETTAPIGRAAIPRWSKWKKRTLAELFGGSQKKHAERLSQEEIDAEAVLMKGLADAERRVEAEEDARLGDGAVEIPSEDEYVG